MGASRTLARKRTKEWVELGDGQFVWADVQPRPRPAKRGTFERRVVTLTPFGAAVERTFHATKGYRQRRVAA